MWRAILLWCGVVAPVWGQFEQPDREAKELPREEQTRAEADAWQAYCKKLAQGTAFQAEIVHRQGDQLSYYRVLFGSACPRPVMYGLALNVRLQAVPPLDPGYHRLLQHTEAVLRVGEVRVAPLAFTTHYLSIHLDDKNATHADLRVSDLGTSMPLPKQAGGVESTYFGGLFRVERLTNVQLAKAEPLRQDAMAMLERLAVLRQEARAYAKNFKGHDLTTAAITWREPALLDRVRKELGQWIDRTPADVVGKGFPNDLCFALGQAGTAVDFPLFERLAKRHPEHAAYLNYPTVQLLLRPPVAEAKPLLQLLFADRAPLQADQKYVKMLRDADATIPVPSAGDDFARVLMQFFELRPASVGFTLAQAEVLAKHEQFKLPAKEVQYLRDATANESGDWFVRSLKDRERVVSALLKWFDTRTK